MKEEYGCSREPTGVHFHDSGLIEVEFFDGWGISCYGKSADRLEQILFRGLKREAL